MRHLLSLFDLTTAEIQQIFALSAELKAKFAAGIREPLFPGRVMALLFEKPSLRTRVSFEAAITHLGGESLFLGDDVGWGRREPLADFARVLSQYVDVIVCRAKSHENVEQLAGYSDCPVVNGLTDSFHPCQALADLFTVQEHFGALDEVRIAYVGDCNNVARSLAIACGKLNVPLAVASPPEYQYDDAFLRRLNKQIRGVRLTCTTDPAEAVTGATAVYTDVWASMGQEAELDVRRKAFADYQVTSEMMNLAAAEACFLHCLPAHRGEEVTDEVIDGPRSVVVQQAANRMHVQKGLLAWLLGGAS